MTHLRLVPPSPPPAPEPAMPRAFAPPPVLRESLMGRETETRHSELSAYLHVVAGDGGAAEFLDVYDEHVALAS